MDRWLAAALAVALGANALVQIFASFWWYGAVPGVMATGPYNPHFVRDVGAAYLVAAGGLAWFAWRPERGWAALVAGAAFLLLHAGVHVFDATCSADPLRDVIRDFPGVYLPALAAAAIAALRRPA